MSSRSPVCRKQGDFFFFFCISAIRQKDASLLILAKSVSTGQANSTYIHNVPWTIVPLPLIILFLSCSWKMTALPPIPNPSLTYEAAWNWPQVVPHEFHFSHYLFWGSCFFLYCFFFSLHSGYSE